MSADSGMIVTRRAETLERGATWRGAAARSDEAQHAAGPVAKVVDGFTRASDALQEWRRMRFAGLSVASPVAARTDEPAAA
jgi:hypothetical protein